MNQIDIVVRQAEGEQVPQMDGGVFRQCLEFLLLYRLRWKIHSGFSAIPAGIIDLPPLTAMSNLQLPEMAVSPVPIIFLAPLDYMVADAAGLPVEGEESFTLLPEQFRPLYPVCEAHTSGNKRLSHPDRPVGRLCLMFMFLSELLQLPKQIQLILFNIDVSFLLFRVILGLFIQR